MACSTMAPTSAGNRPSNTREPSAATRQSKWRCFQACRAAPGASRQARQAMPTDDVLAPIPSPNIASDVIGWVAGAFQVGATGAATYSIPIAAVTGMRSLFQVSNAA